MVFRGDFYRDILSKPIPNFFFKLNTKRTSSSSELLFSFSLDFSVVSTNDVVTTFIVVVGASVEVLGSVVVCVVVWVVVWVVVGVDVVVVFVGVVKVVVVVLLDDVVGASEDVLKVTTTG